MDVNRVNNKARPLFWFFKCGASVEDKLPQITIPELPINELIAQTNNFASNKIIGIGANNNVYSAILENDMNVAIKKHQSSAKILIYSDFFEKLIIASRLKHENVVELLGYYTKGDVHLLAYEFAPLGTLYDVLHGKKGERETEVRPVLTWKQRTKIAIEAAKGLEYLHNKIQPAIVHKNIRTSNILLFEGYTAKIGDIDVFNNASDTDLLRPHSAHVLGTSGYNAPEQIMTGLMTKKSDVYSFGVVLLELLTGKMPIDYSVPKQSLICWATKQLGENKVQECIDPKLNNDYLLSEVVKMAEIAVQCVQFEPWYRPTMTEIVQDLSPLLATSA